MPKRKRTAPKGNARLVPGVSEGPLPATLFKSSLRAWQARRKAEQATGPAEPGTPSESGQAAPPG